MRFIVPALLSVCLMGAGMPAAQAQSYNWRAMPQAGRVAPMAAVTDDQGNTYVAGYMCGSATFGAYSVQIGGPIFNAQCGGDGLFLAKIDATGAWQWARPSQVTMNASRLILDGAGHLYLLGAAWGAYVINGVPYPGVGASDAIIAQISATDGALQWAQAIGSTGEDFFVSGDALPGGEVALAGHFAGDSLRLGSTLLRNTNQNSSSQRLQPFVARLSGTGAWQHARVLPATGFSLADAAFDAAGGAYVTLSRFDSLATIGSQPQPPDAAGLIGYTGATATAWSWTAPLSATPRHLITGAGGLFVSGTFSTPTLMLGGTTLQHQPSGDFDNMFVGRLTPGTGAWQWAVSAPGATACRPAVDQTGRLLLAGDLFQRTSFGNYTLVGPDTAAFQFSSIFAASISANGTWEWAMQDTIDRQWGGSSGGNSIGVDATGQAYLTASVGYALMMHGDWSGSMQVGSLRPNPIQGASPAAAAPSFTLYPNPATHHVTLTTASSPEAQPVQVLDALGRTVRTYSLAPQTSHLELPLAGLPAGVYVVRVGAVARRLVAE